MRRLVIIVVLGLLAGCGSPTPEELASLAAKGYYDHLIHGEYEEFLEGVDVPDYLDVRYKEGQDSYYDQQLDNYRQFMAQQREAHHGIREVRIVRAKTDSVLHYTQVFLTLCFGDSTNEEIVVPMVEREGRWRMK
ncbi:MAG: hypothetical protein IJ067_01395 [Prevotella sp.]|nr:hypothetical protein [Prevotella sp.]